MLIPENALEIVSHLIDVTRTLYQVFMARRDDLGNPLHENYGHAYGIAEEAWDNVGFRWCGMTPLEYDYAPADRLGKYYFVFYPKDAPVPTELL